MVEAFGKARRFSPHGLRHTFASLHLARGTSIKWIQSRGGSASAKLVLDLYGHFLPSDYRGFADAIGTSTDMGRTDLDAPQAHPATVGIRLAENGLPITLGLTGMTDPRHR